MNKITIELCQEDRERIDRLTVALEALQPTKVTTDLPTFRPKKHEESAEQLTIDDVQVASAESHEDATEATETETAPIVPQEVESLPQEEPAPEVEAKPTITLEQVQQKVKQLAAGANGTKKAKVRNIVKAYAENVSNLPEDKLPEIWDKLTALENEA